MDKILDIKNLEKYYGEGTILTKAVDGVSMSVFQSEFVGIMGASGSGKTTLLNCISTIDSPTGGEVLLKGRDITKIPNRDLAKFRRENLGFVFQEYNLLDVLTVEENIGLSLVINKVNKDETARRVREVARVLGIDDILKKFPYEISGGQRQRCACGRAIIHKPSLVLADEPTGSLDSHSSRQLMVTLKELNENDHATILVVTHDPKTASYCKRVLFLKDGKIFNEIFRGEKTQMNFQLEIMDIVALLGGE
ncbi:putative ABC transport system ATP-binding protein [Anaerosphaera aminiphila DSM 21120]|uniref:Putative ABC transport system ATP-binding protein n=1 Tax=Anaerosphaera aminiphila DSM 21120 TaxID=1120995 RepID=A0A1M5QUE3_9FIRM|nr:ABC transporter ATP-binding protein [Anaerosphaera aminiphila]SHH17329.1 putative ABC transport system ATP-binding protein [Anaerosphaera aminiphila DSM 21120]